MTKRKKRSKRYTFTPKTFTLVGVGIGVLGYVYAYYSKPTHLSVIEYITSIVQNTADTSTSIQESRTYIKSIVPPDELDAHNASRMGNIYRHYMYGEEFVNNSQQFIDGYINDEEAKKIKAYNDELEKGVVGLYLDVPEGIESNVPSFRDDDFEYPDEKLPTQPRPPLPTPPEGGKPPPTPDFIAPNATPPTRQPKATKRVRDLPDTIPSAGLTADKLTKEMMRQLMRKDFVSRFGPGTPMLTPLGTTRSNNRTEEIVRDIFEHTFNVQFHSIRPDFLKNPHTGRNLEVDGYAEGVVVNAEFIRYLRVKNTTRKRKVNIGWEYDGVQHSKYKPGMHKNEDDFIYGFMKDKWKDNKFAMRGDILIRIPHVVPRNGLVDFITKALNSVGLEGYAKFLESTT